MPEKKPPPQKKKYNHTHEFVIRPRDIRRRSRCTEKIGTPAEKKRFLSPGRYVSGRAVRVIRRGRICRRLPVFAKLVCRVHAPRFPRPCNGFVWLPPVHHTSRARTARSVYVRPSLVRDLIAARAVVIRLLPSSTVPVPASRIAQGRRERPLRADVRHMSRRFSRGRETLVNRQFGDRSGLQVYKTP